MKPRLSLILSFVVLLPAVMGCEAQTTVLTRIRMPSHPKLSKDRLHYEVMRAFRFSDRLKLPGNRCPTYQKMWKDSEKRGTLLRSGKGFKLKQHAIPTVHEFCMAVWYDTNHNGVIDSGDGLGHFITPYPAQPSRFFSSNRYYSPTIKLRPVP